MIECKWAEDGIPKLDMLDWPFEDKKKSEELLQIIKRFSPSGEWFFICERDILEGDFDPGFRRWESPADYFQSKGRFLDDTPPRKLFSNFERNYFVKGSLPICQESLHMIPNICRAYQEVAFFTTRKEWEDFSNWRNNTVGWESLVRDGYADIVFMNSWEYNFGMILNPREYNYREVINIIRKIAPISQERVEPISKEQYGWRARWNNLWKR